jgi:outer membrane lipoprotein-sorting protein
MKHFTIIAALLTTCITAAYAQNAAAIIDKAASICNQPGGITASFVVYTRSGEIYESFEGVIHIKVDKFALSTPDLKVWYDGKTQWTYMTQIGEVNITTPEGDDLQFTNPALLLTSYRKGFNATLKSEGETAAGKPAYNIVLKPKRKINIVKVELQIEKLSGMPARITMQLTNDLTNTIQISDVKTDVNRPDSLFTFPTAEYLGAEIIDLR